LIGKKCTSCGKVNFPPKAVCKYCQTGNEFEDVQLSGKGTVYTFTIVAGAGAPPEFTDEATAKGRYPVAVIELAEGPHITAQMVDSNPDEVYINMPVEAVVRRIYVEEDVIRNGFKFKPVEG
jgi:uncharacterized OB-fold protein